MGNTQQNKNFQLELDQIIEEITLSGKVPTLLLHSCCGPCSSYVVTYLMEYFRLTVLYYNPCIYPEEEYQHRLAEQKRLLARLQIPLLEIGHHHPEYAEYVRGLESEPEGGKRCAKCFEQRLLKTREIAAEQGYDYFCTTLTVSPHKNAALINRIGQQIADQAYSASSHPLWLSSDFKKREGYKKSIELSRAYHLYRQDYCGCEWSRRTT